MVAPGWPEAGWGPKQSQGTWPLAVGEGEAETPKYSPILEESSPSFYREAPGARSRRKAFSSRGCFLSRLTCEEKAKPSRDTAKDSPLPLEDANTQNSVKERPRHHLQGSRRSLPAVHLHCSQEGRTFKRSGVLPPLSPILAVLTISVPLDRLSFHPGAVRMGWWWSV